MRDSLGVAAVAGFAVFFILLVILGPFITIWALNTLFPVLAIPFTLETYLAVMALGVFLNANISTKKD